MSDGDGPYEHIFSGQDLADAFVVAMAVAIPHELAAREPIPLPGKIEGEIIGVDISWGAYGALVGAGHRRPWRKTE